MKHIFYILFLPFLLVSCSLSNDFTTLPTSDKTLWNTDGNVVLTEEAMTLSGSDARAISTTSYENFILQFEANASENAVGGVYFHSKGYCGLKTGYEVLINNNIDSNEWRKTGSLSAVRNFAECIAKNGEWVPMKIEVRGANIRVYVNNIWVINYTQPQNPYRLPEYEKRILSSGVFVFANHSEAPILFRNIKVKDLEDVATNIADAIDEQNDDVIRLHQKNIPIPKNR